ncbi:MAG: RHS repeat-associated core domain-containing protein [Vicinamibacterales bacterium]
MQTEYSFEPFGGFTTSGASTSNPLTFTGREADGTGLFYYRARFYDPRLQRFVGEDPIGFDGADANLYAYVGNAPVIFSDPLGLKPSPNFGPGPGVRGLGPRGPSDPRPRWGQGPDAPSPSSAEPPDPQPECPSFGDRWWRNVRDTNTLFPGLLTPAGLGGGLGAVGSVSEYFGVPTPRPVTIFTPPAATPRFLSPTWTAVRAGAWVSTGLAWEAGVFAGSAIDAGLLHPCAGW